MNSSERYIISNHIKYEISGGAGDRLLIIPNIGGVPDMKKVLCLSDTSLLIWEMIADNKSFNLIVEEISQRYSKKKEEIEDDVKDFIGTLLEDGYISVMEWL